MTSSGSSVSTTSKNDVVNAKQTNYQQSDVLFRTSFVDKISSSHATVHQNNNNDSTNNEVTSTTTTTNDTMSSNNNSSNMNNNNNIYHISKPTNQLVTPMLTDLYQLTMVYAHWKNNKVNQQSVFEVFFRNNPFGGEYTIFTGLDEVIKFLYHYKFTEDDIYFLKYNVPSFQYCDHEFFNWLLSLNTKDVTIHALPDGSIAFPRVPLITIIGPLGICQLLETTILTLVNYPSLVATNAARMVIAASKSSSSSSIPRNISTTSLTSTTSSEQQQQQLQKNHHPNELSLPKQCYVTPVCVEFGLRRAQGPDGGFSASKYSSIGGFVATSNVLAGKYLGLTISGTHAHAFVQAYSNLLEIENNTIKRNNTKTNKTKEGTTSDTEHADVEPNVILQNNTDTKVSSNSNDDVNETEILLLPIVLKYRDMLSKTIDERYNTTNDGELAAFIAYATAFPYHFLCLIDTYDTLHSGLYNFIIVALALYELGYIAIGIRLDSGDLAYLSMECAKHFQLLASLTNNNNNNYTFFEQLSIVASNDINEDVLHALSKQEHAITVYGIGTNLVTCQAQPALGCVYKLVEIEHKPRMKLSQEISKVLIPCKKKLYRLYGKDSKPILDLLMKNDEAEPVLHQKIMCRHPFISRKRAIVTPSKIVRLDRIVYENGIYIENSNYTLQQAKYNVIHELNNIRPDILRYMNPTPYKVSVTQTLYDLLHDLWQSETPVPELS